jgi:hypothetical protein
MAANSLAGGNSGEMPIKGGASGSGRGCTYALPAASGAGASAAIGSTSVCLCQTALPILQRMLGADKAILALYHRRREHVAAALFTWRLCARLVHLEQRRNSKVGRLPPGSSGLAVKEGQHPEIAGDARSNVSWPKALTCAAEDPQAAATGAHTIFASDRQHKADANAESVLREAVRRSEMCAERLRVSEQSATTAQRAAE